MDKHGDSVASIDVAVAFFAAVLAVFAMIEFTRPTAPQQPELPTIGPAVPTVTVTPPWLVSSTAAYRVRAARR